MSNFASHMMRPPANTAQRQADRPDTSVNVNADDLALASPGAPVTYHTLRANAPLVITPESVSRQIAVLEKCHEICTVH